MNLIFKSKNYKENIKSNPGKGRKILDNKAEIHKKIDTAIQYN